jgi:hypothetical protein
MNHEATQPPEAATRPPDVTALLGRAEKLLQTEGPRVALGFLKRHNNGSPWIVNAYGVCLLRQGDAQQAMAIFRSLVLGAGGFALRPDAPTVFKTNYATALLLTDNVPGGRSILDQVRDEGHPSVQRLRGALRRWWGSFTFLEKVRWFFGGAERPIVLDFSPGEF